MIVAGIGIAMRFPTVANAVTASVPDGDVGVAAGTNNALNALGGVFGVAILAAVFAARGSYASPAAFIRLPARGADRRGGSRRRRSDRCPRPPGFAGWGWMRRRTAGSPRRPSRPRPRPGRRDATWLYAFGVTFRPLARSHSMNSASPMNVKAATLTELPGTSSALELPTR